MDFQTYLKDSASKIEDQIAEYKSEWQQEIAEISPKLLPLTDIFSTAWEGGKRLRGALVRLGYELATNSENNDIYSVSIAYEIFQTAILAHDDIIDLSPLRRGKPTLYRQLGGDHYGISQTICLADIGFFLANKLIVDSNFNPENKIKALHDFSKMVINTGLGEMLDIELPHLNETRHEDDILKIYELKTAYYTIVYPLRVGAILGGASNQLLEKINQFGNALGTAFQIQDDVLGIFGDEKTLGKSVTSDIEEGKSTILLTYAMENSDKKQVDILTRYYGVGAIEAKEVDWIKKAFIDSGALDYAKQKELEYVQSAKNLIPELTKDNSYQQLLEQMADFLVQRSK